MKYKLTKCPNPETHAYGDVIFVKDEDGNELNVFFKDEFEAFDYIKLQVENDEKYSDYLKNPSEHIMDMYNSLDEFDKKMIEQSLIQKYRNECMYQYFRQVRNMKSDFSIDNKPKLRNCPFCGNKAYLIGLFVSCDVQPGSLVETAKIGGE